MAVKLKEIDALLESGKTFFEKGSFDDAVSSYSRAMDMCGKEAKDRRFAPHLAAAYNGMGHTLRSKGEFNKSKQFQDKALAMYKELVLKDAKLQPDFALSLHFMGDILADLGQADKALFYYLCELKIARKLYAKNKKKNQNMLIYGLNGTACRLADKKDYKKALALLGESLKVLESASKNAKERRKNYPNLSWTYHIIGTTLLKKSDVDGAIANLKAAAKMRKVIAKENVRFTEALKNTLNKLGDAYSMKGKVKEANVYYKDALRIVTSKTYQKQVVASKSSKEKRQLLAKMRANK